MRILQFCSKPPLPSIDGGCLASYELSINLMDLGHDLSILTLSTEKHPFKISEENRDFYIKTHAANVSVSTQKSALFYLLNFLSNRSIQEQRFYNDNAWLYIKKYLSKNNFDLIIFDGLMVGSYYSRVKEFCSSKLIYRSHNIEYQLLKERSREFKNPLKHLLFKSESNKLRNLESELWENAAQVWTISRNDTSFILENSSSVVKYIPFSSESIEVGSKEIPNTFFHLGAMDWSPNFEGIQHFFNTIWKEFAKNKDVELHLGGKGISRIKDKIEGKGIVVHENVPSANEFFGNYEILIVPIKTGSGIRVKTIQALSMSKVIITTEAGAKGIPAENTQHLLVCNSDEEMLKAMNEVVDNNDLKEKLKREGRKLFETEFSRQIVKENISSALLEL